MSFTYGFYNAVNHDRVYDARQLTAIFDGIINDGVYESQGERFMVRPASQGMGVTVASGRAWFDHTWNYNDSLLPLTIAMSDVLLNRIDAIVLETNTSTSVRANSIKVITGIPAETPSKPSMTRSEYINQYPLAYVSVPANTSTVDAANIENAVGTSACPYVTGLLQVISIDNLVAQWQAQWENYFRDLKSWTNTEKANFVAWEGATKEEFTAWIIGQEAEFLAWKRGFKADAASWESDFEADAVAWRTRERARWEEWFRNIQYVLDGDAAGHLQNEIDVLDETLHRDMNTFEEEVEADVNDFKTAIDERTFLTIYSMCNAHTEFDVDQATGRITEIRSSNSDLSATSTVTFEKEDNIETVTEEVSYNGETYTHTAVYDRENEEVTETYTKGGNNT